MKVTNVLMGARGREVPLTSTTSAVNGRPTLLIGGAAVRNDASEGWSPKALAGTDVAEQDVASSGEARLNFFNGWLFRGAGGRGEQVEVQREQRASSNGLRVVSTLMPVRP